MAVVVFIRARPGNRRVHSGSLGSLGFVFGSSSSCVHLGALCGSLSSFGRALRVVGFIRARRLVNFGSMG